MEVSQVLGERGRWDKYMPVLANLLRPSAEAGPVAELLFPDGDLINDAITAFRNSEGETLKVWGDQIVALVFDGYADWGGYYAASPDWVLTNLAQVLEDSAQQTALLTHLQSIADALPETRNECLVAFKNDIDQWVPRWQYSANTELAGAEGPMPEGEERAKAYQNTGNWNYSRTPGTFYYKYVERDGKNVYVYNDNAGAPDEDWHEAQYWDDLAEAEARKPGNKLTTKFPDWDSSWAAWSVLDNQKAEGGRVYGKADEGRWYDYNGAVAAHSKEVQERVRAAQPAPQGTAATGSPLTVLARDIHDEVMVPLAEQVLQKLPPQTAGKEGIDVLVRQYVRDDISRRMADLAGQKE